MQCLVVSVMRLPTHWVIAFSRNAALVDVTRSAKALGSCTPAARSSSSAMRVTIRSQSSAVALLPQALESRGRTKHKAPRIQLPEGHPLELPRDRGRSPAKRESQAILAQGCGMRRQWSVARSYARGSTRGTRKPTPSPAPQFAIWIFSVPQRPQRSPEDWLGAALGARTAGTRAKYATQGLACESLDHEVQGLLLRQLYLAHLERGRYLDARHVAEQLVQVRVLGDVAYRDVAVACLALDDLTAAVAALRLAGRQAPPVRRAVHLSSLASLYYLTGRPALSRSAAERALRWADHRSPLYEAQVALAEAASGLLDGERLRLHLEQLRPTRSLFGTFVSAELYSHLGEVASARSRLDEFRRGVRAASPLVRAGLAAEYRRACRDLA